MCIYEFEASVSSSSLYRDTIRRIVIGALAGIAHSTSTHEITLYVRGRQGSEDTTYRYMLPPLIDPQSSATSISASTTTTTTTTPTSTTSSPSSLSSSSSSPIVHVSDTVRCSLGCDAFVSRLQFLYQHCKARKLPILSVDGVDTLATFVLPNDIYSKFESSSSSSSSSSSTMISSLSNGMYSSTVGLDVSSSSPLPTQQFNTLRGSIVLPNPPLAQRQTSSSQLMEKAALENKPTVHDDEPAVAGADGARADVDVGDLASPEWNQNPLASLS